MPDYVDKTVTRLVVLESETEDMPLSATPPSATPSFARAQIDFTDKSRVDAVLKDVSMDEFLRIVEGSSCEELEQMLKTVKQSATTDVRKHAKFNYLVAFRNSPAVNSISQMMKPLFTAPSYEFRTIPSIIAWWESRRIAYNIIVGTAGCVTGFFMHVLGFASINSLIGGAIAYGIMANICYTSGWMAELTARWLWKEKAENFGPILLSLGLIFSVLLTLLPAVMSVSVFVSRMFLPSYASCMD